MKKILLTLCFLTACFSIHAQKSYVNMVSRYVYRDGVDPTTPYIYLSGDVPANIEKKYNLTTTTGDVLNMLAEEGFIVECLSMSSHGGSGAGFSQTILLSKSSSNSPSSVRYVQIGDEDVTEIARYNLQGIPVLATEKGVQIIVYSNYTTKTIIVQ